jgi:DNA-binding transcriptional MerR regulator
MKIHEFSQKIGLSEKTIRYYEEIGIFPLPRRSQNGYRHYDNNDIEKVKFVIGARILNLSLDEIAEILDMRDRRKAPCRAMLNSIEQKISQISENIRLLQKMETELKKLHKLGLKFSLDDIDGKHCICHLVSKQADKKIDKRRFDNEKIAEF